MYLLGVYFTVLTIATVGYGDITPMNKCKRISSTDEQLYTLGLIAFGVIVYSNTLGRISKWFVDEDEIQKIRQYNVAAELSALELIDKKIGRQICDQIDASLQEGPKKKLEDWHDLMQKVSFRDKKQVP